jgi:very-short-patch-repair endonuclease
MPVFRRQHPIGRYVLDFYCAGARLAVEIDGLSHDLGDRPQRDSIAMPGFRRVGFR